MRPNKLLLLNIKRIQILVFILIMSMSLAVEANIQKLNLENIDRHLQEIVRTYKIPGLAVAIVHENEIIFESCYGDASPGVDVSVKTPFLLGSTTKTFTALAVMKLVVRGEMKLDDPVNKYLPEFELAEPGLEEKITIRHLLHHRSGLSNKGMQGTTSGEDTLEKELYSLKSCVPTSKPGEKYVYFNTNYRLLGLIIERVSGKKYGEFLNEELFKPLSMENTYAGPDGVKGLAAGYGQFLSMPFQRKQIYRPGALPSGYIASSISDLARFLVAEIQAGSGKSGVLDINTVKTTWKAPNNSKEGYAMGWLVINDSKNGHLLIHGGSLENYQSFLYINPESQTGFVFLMNQGGILPMLMGFNTVRDNLIKIVNGQQPDNVTVDKLPLLIVSVLFFLLLGVEIFRTIRLKKYKSSLSKKKRSRYWLVIFIEFFWSFFLLFGLNPFMNMIMGDNINWSLLYGLLPELFFLLVSSIIFGILRGLFKLWVLI